MKANELGGKKAGGSLKRIFARSDTMVIIATMVLFAIFAIFTDSFLSAYNLFNISRTAALYIFIALGQAMALIVGGMNLSLGQIGGLTVVVAGFCMDKLQVDPVVAVFAGLGVGILCGFLNGIIIIKLRLSPFVATLATSFILAGLINGISQGYPYTNIPESFTILGRDGIGNFAYLILLAVAVLFVVWFIFRYTVPGRRLLATGGNMEAARLSAVNTNKMLVIANIASGLFAAIAGLLWISRMGAAQPATGGDWMLISFAVAVIGGTSLVGGMINPLGIFFSSFLIVMVKNGLVMLNANVYLEQTFLGIILLLAVSLDSIRNIVEDKRLKRSLKHKDAEGQQPQTQS